MDRIFNLKRRKYPRRGCHCQTHQCLGRPIRIQRNILNSYSTPFRITDTLRRIQAALFSGLISRCIFLPCSLSTCLRSNELCRLSQNWAVVLKKRARRSAVSGEIARRSRTMSLIRGAGTRNSIASAFALIHSGTRNSSRKISPGCIGRILFVAIVVTPQ